MRKQQLTVPAAFCSSTSRPFTFIFNNKKGSCSWHRFNFMRPSRMEISLNVINFFSGPFDCSITGKSSPELLSTVKSNAKRNSHVSYWRFSDRSEHHRRHIFFFFSCRQLTRQAKHKNVLNKQDLREIKTGAACRKCFS